MLNLNRMPEGSSEDSIPFSNEPVANVLDSHDESVVGDPTTHPYLLNHNSDNDGVDNELLEFPHEDEDDDEEEEDNEEVQGVNFFGQMQPAYAQPSYTMCPHIPSQDIDIAPSMRSELVHGMSDQWKQGGFRCYSQPSKH
ncbi:hypothetical protein PIB30_051756 [Stylosanthes scabra]|uniref:Uncharacterized protein n=1 Tax=Stylosanthes scabra TaxID=79078 RepID=A0ABU6VJ13_9FABA|nr:hypothetical protein [Stylosanthes scabra]